MAHRFLCGVPKNECMGALTKVNAALRSPIKTHVSNIEAFKCRARYLKNMGYKQIGPREFKLPDDGPVLVLTKKSRYGARLRHGKLQERNQPKNGGGVVVG